MTQHVRLQQHCNILDKTIEKNKCASGWVSCWNFRSLQQAVHFLLRMQLIWEGGDSNGYAWTVFRIGAFTIATGSSVSAAARIAPELSGRGPT